MTVHAGKCPKVIKTRVKLQRLSQRWLVRIEQQEYGSIAIGVGENPLNGKGVPLTRNGEGGEIV